jgi:gluconokinase
MAEQVQTMKASFYIIMGVSGSGKSAAGCALAKKLGWDFYDGDDFHSPANITKMAAGIPLDDADRAPWLAALHDLIAHCLKTHRPGVLACSALKQSYRDELLAGSSGVQVVYLKGTFELISARLSGRAGHYMKPAMLRSQFEALEEPQNALTVDISLSLDEIVNKIISA